MREFSLKRFFSSLFYKFLRRTFRKKMAAEEQESHGQPPWRYAVLFGAFLVNFLNMGTVKSLGVLIPELEEDFKSGVSLLGLAVGMCHGAAVGLGKSN